MIASSFEHIRIVGVAGALPTKKINSMDYASVFDAQTVTKLISSTEVKECYHVHEKQTASDLAYAAGKHLIEQLHIEIDTIGILVFVVAFPDYFAPASAMVLHKRLGLPKDCIVYDINLSCSGMVYGLQTVSSLLQTSTAKRALLLVGDTTSKVVSPYDTSCILFGDGGGAILLEKTDQVSRSNFGLKTDGSRYQKLIVPAGGFRNPCASHEYTERSDGNRRSDYNLYMDGTDIFGFSMTDVPALFREFMEYYRVSPGCVDALIMHQPNAFIIRHLAKKLKIPMEKVPLSLDRYGNTSGASIPITLCDAYGARNGESLHLLLCGFGVGLSWGVVELDINTDVILPLIHTDEYYEDNLIQ